MNHPEEKKEKESNLLLTVKGRALLKVQQSKIPRDKTWKGTNY